VNAAQSLLDLRADAAVLAARTRRTYGEAEALKRTMFTESDLVLLGAALADLRAACDELIDTELVVSKLHAQVEREIADAHRKAEW